MLDLNSLSVVLPAFNEEKNIEKTIINSFIYLNKKFKDFEIIVVDDGSTDLSSKIVEKSTVNYTNVIIFLFTLTEFATILSDRIFERFNLIDLVSYTYIMSQI